MIRSFKKVRNKERTLTAPRESSENVPAGRHVLVTTAKPKAVVEALSIKC